jgi:hypothetical protein
MKTGYSHLTVVLCLVNGFAPSVGRRCGAGYELGIGGSPKPPPDEEWCPWANPTGTSAVRGQGDHLSASKEIS